MLVLLVLVLQGHRLLLVVLGLLAPVLWHHRLVLSLVLVLLALVLVLVLLALVLIALLPMLALVLVL